MSATMTAQFVTDALIMAVWRRGRPKALMHHSDRGSQYTQRTVPAADGRSRRDLFHEPFRQLLGQQRGDGELLLLAQDRERTARKTYRTLGPGHEPTSSMPFERFYNPKRRHSTLGYLSTYGVRIEGWCSLSACQPNRQQLKSPGPQWPALTKVLSPISSITAGKGRGASGEKILGQLSGRAPSATSA